MRLRLVLLTGVAATIALAGCTSGSDPAPTSAAASTSSSGDAAALATSLRGSVAALTSAHFVVTGTIGGQRLTGAGDQKITNGKLTGLQAQATLPGGLGGIALVVDGTDRYVKLPAALAAAGKPWVRVTPNSTNLVVKQLAGVLDAALTAADAGGLADLVGAAKSVRKVGTSSVGGAPATRYALVVDPAKLPDDLAGKAGLGTADIPASIWLDAQRRPVQVVAAVPVAGQPVDVTVTFSKFDEPVTITPPDPSVVGQ